MFAAVHTLVYSDPAETMAFVKDVLRWPFVSEGSRSDACIGDTGTGRDDPAQWLTFGTGPSEMGVHPASGEQDGRTWSAPQHHSIAIMCDYLDVTMSELLQRGAEFAGPPQEMGFCRDAQMHVPGADDMLVYPPHHAVAYQRS